MLTRNLTGAGSGSLLRALTLAVSILAVGSFGATSAIAQEMKAPEGEIDLTIGAGPGSGPDLTQRRVADILNKEGLVSNPIVVNNRTGGSWTVASQYVIDHKGDENLLFGMSPTVFATPIVRGVPNFYEQFTPLAVLIAADLLIVVSADSPYQTLQDVVDAAKKEEGAVSVAGANVGSTDHIVTTLLEEAAGVKLNFVPFDGGGGQITSAVLGGATDIGIYPPDEALSLIEGGKFRPLAILSEERHPSPKFSDIPTAKEQGFDIVWDSPQSLALPGDVDPALVAWWDDKIGKMVKSAAWQKVVEDNYYRDAYVPQAEAKAAMDGLYERYHTVLNKLGLAKPQQ